MSRPISRQGRSTNRRSEADCQYRSCDSHPRRPVRGARSGPFVSCRPVPPRGVRYRAASPRPARSDTGLTPRAAPVRSRAAGRTPSRPDMIARRPRPSVPHGLARDSPCTCRKVPGSVGGGVRPSRSVAVPAPRWNSNIGPCAPPRGKSPAPARSPVCSLLMSSVPESWCVALDSTCWSFSGRMVSPMRRSCF